MRIKGLPARLIEIRPSDNLQAGGRGTGSESEEGSPDLPAGDTAVARFQADGGYRLARDWPERGMKNWAFLSPSSSIMRKQ